MAKKKPLGKGLEALLPTEEENYKEIPLNDLLPNPYNPRADPGDLSELIASIKEKGVIEPIVVRKKEDKYEVVCGSRRVAACKELGLEVIPAIVKDVDDRGMLEFALIENLQRKDLNPIEEAEAYQRLNKEFGLSHEEIAERVGKNRATITNTIRLLNLPDEIKEMLKRGELTEGHARALLQAETEEKMVELAQRILKEKLTVREVEKLAKKRVPMPKEEFLINIERKFSENFGVKANIKKGKRSYKIEIRCKSFDEFKEFLKKLGLEL